MSYDVKKLPLRAKRAEPVGSRVTVSPPPMHTDEDYLVLVGMFTPVRRAMLRAGFTAETQDYGDLFGFSSWRSGEVNVIVTRTRAFFRAFMAATHVAKRLNLREKADRIALFQAVLYRNIWRS